MNHIIKNIKNIINNDDKNFIAKLPKDFYRKYKMEKVDLLKKFNHEWNYNLQISKKLEGIDTYKYHKDILNACIFPFIHCNTMPQNLDYSYICSSPLSERGLSNVDFLIASEADQVLLFGEAKASVTDPNRVISEYRKRIQIIEENVEYIKEKYSNMNAYRHEYVLCVPSGFSNNTAKAIIRSKINIILWEIDMWHNPTLSLHLVAKDVRQDIDVDIMHSNNSLNKTLSRLDTSTACKAFFNESHTVIKMGLLTTINKNFSFIDVKKLVNSELDNTSKADIDKISHDIIECGINIGFIKSLNNNFYKIQSRFKRAGARYKELENKWIKTTIETDKCVNLEKKIEELQTKYLSRINTLD